MLGGSNAFAVGPDFAVVAGNEDWLGTAKFVPKEGCAEELLGSIEDPF